jgi:hypothetical protein
METQGLAILRQGNRYASLECGITGGGHGHADRLHLTLHADGVYWLPDPGTGSYVTADLFWYRSTLAHNAPRLDGADQPAVDAQCEAFAAENGWAWALGRFGGWTRTLVSAPEYLLDVVEFSAEEEHIAELAWHPQGSVEVTTPGRWESVQLEEAFLSDPGKFVPGTPGSVGLTAQSGDARLALHLNSGADLFRAGCPGLPGSSGASTMYFQRESGRYVRLASVLTPGAGSVSALRAEQGGFTVSTPKGDHVHRSTPEGWEVQTPAGRVLLRGRRRQRGAPILRLDLQPPPATAEGYARHVAAPPALDGSLRGFDQTSPLFLDHEDQYRRSELPYAESDEFAAEAWVNWDEGHLYLAVAVAKDEPMFRSPDEPPLELDNEADAIHSDGLQVYLEPGPGQGVLAYLIVPDSRSDGLTARAIEGTAGDPAGVRGAWRLTETGYVITIGMAVDAWRGTVPPVTIRFDLLVNQALPGHERRAGQLVWSGGGGWVYLRGDRQPLDRFGQLETV